MQSILRKVTAMNGEYEAEAMITSNWRRRIGEWELQNGNSPLATGNWVFPCSSLPGRFRLQVPARWVYLFEFLFRSWRPLPYLVTLRSLGIQISLGQVLIIGNYFFTFLPRWGGQLVVLRFSPWLAWYHQDSRGLLYHHKSLPGHISRKVLSQHYLPDSRLWSSSKMVFSGYGSVWALGFLLFFVCRAYYFSSTFFINNYVHHIMRYIPIHWDHDTNTFHRLIK